jgi:hypothetical protein
MSNLGAYQAMATIAKKVGGPKVLAAITIVGGYVVIRPADAGAKKAVQAIKRRSEPCATKGQLFRATADGDDSGLRIRVGDEYGVLECDGEVILIEVLGDPGSPYFVPDRRFLVGQRGVLERLLGDKLPPAPERRRGDYRATGKGRCRVPVNYTSRARSGRDCPVLWDTRQSLIALARRSSARSR